MANSNQSKRFSRRNLLKIAGVSALVAAGCSRKVTAESRSNKQADTEKVSSVTADQALQILKEGNQRYVSKKLSHPHQTEQRITEIAKGQHPFAMVLGCADSRVSPEIIFDQGLGDLFVMRVAGNIVDDAIVGSIEYAAEELGVPLLVVLGHEKCGAVAATLKGGKIPGHISTLVKAIKPAVERTKNQAGDKLDNAVRANVKLVVEQLKSSKPLLFELVEKNKLKIVGGRYDLDSGKVDMIV